MVVFPSPAGVGEIAETSTFLSKCNKGRDEDMNKEERID
jgi:hypothetical protein